MNYSIVIPFILLGVFVCVGVVYSLMKAKRVTPDIRYDAPIEPAFTITLMIGLFRIALGIAMIIYFLKVL